MLHRCGEISGAAEEWRRARRWRGGAVARRGTQARERVGAQARGRAGARAVAPSLLGRAWCAATPLGCAHCASVFRRCVRRADDAASARVGVPQPSAPVRRFASRMDLHASVRTWMLGALIECAPRRDLALVAAALDLPAPPAVPTPSPDDADLYVHAFEAAVEAGGVTLFHLLRGMWAYAGRSETTGLPKTRWIHRRFVNIALAERSGRTPHQFPYTDIEEDGGSEVYHMYRGAVAPQWFREHVMPVIAWVDGFPYRSPPGQTATEYPRWDPAPPNDDGAGAEVPQQRRYEYVTLQVLAQGLVTRFPRTHNKDLYAALAALPTLDWAAVVPLLDLVRPASIDDDDADARWPSDRVYALLRRAERQGVTAHRLYDAFLRVGHLRAADLVVWHLTHHPRAYARAFDEDGDAKDPPAKRRLTLAPPETDENACVGETGSVVGRLPPELLVAILWQLTELADVVVCRHVCRRWRAAVAEVAARDRLFAYCCGTRDWLAVQGPPAFPSMSSFVARLTNFNQRRHAIVDVCCTCGRLLPNDLASILLRSACADPDPDPAVTRVQPPYRGRHGGVPAPPAPWHRLRPSRTLALELARACSKIDVRAAMDRVFYELLATAWLPLFLWIAAAVVRPSDATALLALTRALVHTIGDDAAALDQLWTILSDATAARAWYDDHGAAVHGPVTAPGPLWESVWDACSAPRFWSATSPERLHLDANAAPSIFWEARNAAFQRYYPDYVADVTNESFADDAGNWQRHRYLTRRAALWCKVFNDMNPDSGETDPSLFDPFIATNYDTLAAHLFHQVHVWDEVAGLFAQRCTVSCVYMTGNTHFTDRANNTDVGPKQPTLWMLGLDRTGHVVGAVSSAKWPE